MTSTIVGSPTSRARASIATANTRTGDYNFNNAMGTVPALASTRALAITQSAFSSFATPQIVVPFPSQYANQVQLAYTFSDVPVYTRTPNTYGGVEATNGYASMIALATSTANSGSGSGGGGSGGGGGEGFHWPVWATAVCAGVGGALLLTVILACCCWRKRAARRKRERQQRHRNRVNSNANRNVESERSKLRNDKAAAAAMLLETEKAGLHPSRMPPRHVGQRDGRERIPSNQYSDKVNSNDRFDYDYRPTDYPAPLPPADLCGVASHGSPRRHNQYFVHPDAESPPRSLDPEAYGPLPLHHGVDWSEHRRMISGASDDTGYTTPDERASARTSFDGSPSGLLANAAPHPRSRSHGRARPGGAGDRHSVDYAAGGGQGYHASRSRPMSYPAALSVGGGTALATSDLDIGQSLLGSAMLVGDDPEDDPSRLRVNNRSARLSQISRSTGRSTNSVTLGALTNSSHYLDDRASFETSLSANIHYAASSRSKTVEVRRSKSLKRNDSPNNE
ncbi:BQ2448_4545 [Microbotryum intermedium]|uniref:BQ2448_4545 protein n=1 Tax=Microbotryum intermedium TaxID=269621 RepID=A0A238FI73_9BASI|nr:BQ2448_4545 [Microbotryum intermedium]